MSLLLLVVQVAHAECSSRWTLDEVRRSVSAARADADTEAAEKAISDVLDSLTCPAQVLPEGELTDIFTLGAALANRLGDTSNQERFLTAAALVDVGATPRVDEAAVGKEVAGLYRSRFAQIHQAEVTVRARSTVFVDGRALPEGEDVMLAPGEHVVQYTQRGGLVTEVVEIASGASTSEIGPKPAASTAGGRAGRTALGVGLLAAGVGSFWAAVQLSHDAGAVGGDNYVIPAYAAAIGGSALVAGGLTVFVVPPTPNNTSATAGVGFSHAF